MNSCRGKRHCHQRAPRGISLVELVVVMSAATVILTISAALLHRMLLTHSAARAFTDVERTSLRLANTLRSDVHQARSATTTEAPVTEGPFLQLELPSDQRIEYRHEQTEVLRILLDDERIVAHEAFRFQQEIEVAARKDGPRLLTVSIQSHQPSAKSEDGGPASAAHAVPVHLHVQAVINRDSLP